MLKFIFYFLWVFITMNLTYKYVRHIDKKERKFLKQWEKEYIEAYAETWKIEYFKKLAEEKKIKEYQEKLAREKEEQKKRLKSINIDEQYEKEFEENLKNAEFLLASEEEQE